MGAFDGGIAKVTRQQMGGRYAVADSRLNQGEVVESRCVVGK